jgi:hypothetical protein
MHSSVSSPVMSSRLCYAWFGDEGGGGSKRAEPESEKPSRGLGLFHDGRKWVFKRNGKVVAESKATFSVGDPEEPKN